MKRKQIIDLIIAICLLIAGSVLLIFPLLKVYYVKYIFMGILTFYGLANLAQFILTSSDKDYEGLLTMFASIISLVILGLLNMKSEPLNIAVVLFTWIALMSAIKLKKCDYYHDRHKKIWIFKIITLLLFILAGLLTVINLYYSPNVQIIVLGFFFFIHGILELTDPIIYYLLENKTN